MASPCSSLQNKQKSSRVSNSSLETELCFQLPSHYLLNTIFCPNCMVQNLHRKRQDDGNVPSHLSEPSSLSHPPCPICRCVRNLSGAPVKIPGLWFLLARLADALDISNILDCLVELASKVVQNLHAIPLVPRSP